MNRTTRKDAKAAVRQMHQLGEHWQLEDALARGEISQSWVGRDRRLNAEAPRASIADEHSTVLAALGATHQ